MKALIALASGLIFALGLGLSGMTQPHVVRGFLDVDAIVTGKQESGDVCRDISASQRPCAPRRAEKQEYSDPPPRQSRGAQALQDVAGEGGRTHEGR